MMVSLWGSGKNDHETAESDQRTGDDENQPDSRASVRRGHREPDEHTRLLPRGGEGFLSPDDPAVSPYNLWSVRALKGLSIILLVITFIWWIFLLISVFVTPPMMQTRGSGFFSFSYATLTLGNLIFGLLFFAVPSKPMTVWGLVLAVLLFADMIIILSFPRIRTQEGWVGIASVIWAALIAVHNVGQNQAVAKGKHEEEERLTGRVETRRSLLEWLAVFTETVIMGIITIVAILLTATLILRARDASLESPGKMYLVDNNKYAVHLACVGVDNGDRESTLTVLLEAGERPVEAGLQPFIDTLYQNGTVDRYCYWDRPGFAWSDNAPSPHSAGMSADSLAEALALAGEEGPWVLVSADIGGIYSRIFASRHAHSVHGILLIDTLHEDDLQNIGRPGRGFVLWLRGIISPLGLDRLAGAIFKGRTREDRVFGQSSYQNGQYIKVKLQENLVAEPITSTEITTARRIQSRKTQLVVVSSGLEVRRSEKWAKKQEDLTTITDNLISWDIVKSAPHDVWTASEGRKVLAQRLKQLLVNENSSRQSHL